MGHLENRSHSEIMIFSGLMKILMCKQIGPWARTPSILRRLWRPVLDLFLSPSLGTGQSPFCFLIWLLADISIWRFAGFLYYGFVLFYNLFLSRILENIVNQPLFLVNLTGEILWTLIAFIAYQFWKQYQLKTLERKFSIYLESI